MQPGDLAAASATASATTHGVISPGSPGSDEPGGPDGRLWATASSSRPSCCRQRHRLAFRSPAIYPDRGLTSGRCRSFDVHSERLSFRSRQLRLSFSGPITPSDRAEQVRAYAAAYARSAYQRLHRVANPKVSAGSALLGPNPEAAELIWAPNASPTESSVPPTSPDQCSCADRSETG